MEPISLNSEKQRQRQRWETSSTVNGITKSVDVQEVENGFVITLSKYGYESSDVKQEKYIDEIKKYIATENPLKDQKEVDVKDSSGIKELFNTLDGEIGLMTIN